MIVTGRHLSRRTVLRGLGVSLALPLLDSMVPAFAARRTTAALQPVKRLAAVYAPMGMNMSQWTPSTEGPLALSPILAPLAGFKERLLVVSGLDNASAVAGRDGASGGHSRCQGTWLTGARAKRTEGEAEIGTSMDQVAAQAIGGETQLASLELALESVDLVGACETGYTCAYVGTISWRNPRTPLPMEVNPRAVFERLFGASESTDRRSRLLQIEADRSILDAVNADMVQLQQKIGSADRTKVEQYFEAIRDVERRISRASEQVDQELPVVDRPSGVPATFEDHAALMYDLLALAYQTDLTRVSTFMIGRDLSARTFPEIGVPDPWHPLSHHGNNPESLAKQAKLNIYHMNLFARFLEKLQATPDGDGSLLDHTLLLYGSGMSNSNVHHPLDVPTMVVGNSTVGIQGDRHLRVPSQTLANLQLSLLERMGVQAESFGDSTGPLAL